MKTFTQFLSEAQNIEFTKSGKQLRSFDNVGEFVKHMKQHHDVDVSPSALEGNNIRSHSGDVVGYARRIPGGNDQMKYYAVASHSSGYGNVGNFLADLKD